MKLLQLIVQLSSLVGMVLSYDDLGEGVPTDFGARFKSIKTALSVDDCAGQCPLSTSAGFTYDLSGSTHTCFCYANESTGNTGDGVIGTLRSISADEIFNDTPVPQTASTYCYECREPSQQPSLTPSQSPSLKPSVQPSMKPSLAPSESPSLKPSAQPSMKPSTKPSLAPSESPSLKPSAQPSLKPSTKPSLAPSGSPSLTPSAQPSLKPSTKPSLAPSESPSLKPSVSPSLTPSAQPSLKPSTKPSLAPSESPSLKPSAQPSLKPSLAPSDSPSLTPSAQPSMKPSKQPSESPSDVPSKQPSESPSEQPSKQPSETPTKEPSETPSSQPSSIPSESPSSMPSSIPSGQPSSLPSENPSSQPSSIPSESPSSIPSENPSSQPSSIPSENPSSQPSSNPSESPSSIPSESPSSQPSSIPSEIPSSIPSENPSSLPSSIPSESPSSIPSENPSSQPSSIPSESPSSIPSENPSIQPSSIPSESPSSIPSENPSSQPSETPSISSKPTVTSSPSSTVGHVKTAGGFSINAPLCNLNVTATDRVVRALNEALMLAGCPIKDPSCTAHTLSICKKPPNISFVQDPYAPPLTQSTRNLQQSTRHLLELSEVGFEIIAAVECKNAACTTDGDIATSKDIADKITQRINAAIQSGVVAGVIANALSLDCLVAWGGITSPSVSSKFVSEGSLSKVGVAIPTSGTFYPDWYGKSGSCINDGNAPTYMQLKPSQWIYDNLDACCDRYYSGYEKPKCMNGQGSGLWVVDWDDERCSLDCAVSTGGLCAGTVGGTVTKYSDPLTCCKNQLPWVSSEFCQYDSLRTNDNCYDGTKKYYSNDKTCVKDCKTGSPGCGGLVSEPHVQLYPSIDTCCAAQFSWVTRGLCVSRSSSTTTDQYWADKGKSKCVKDSVTPATDLTVVLYKTAKECCKSITWVTSAACVAGSN